jgi:hypothetical protein
MRLECGSNVTARGGRTARSWLHATRMHGHGSRSAARLLCLCVRSTKRMACTVQGALAAQLVASQGPPPPPPR